METKNVLKGTVLGASLLLASAGAYSHEDHAHHAHHAHHVHHVTHHHVHHHVHHVVHHVDHDGRYIHRTAYHDGRYMHGAVYHDGRYAGHYVYHNGHRVWVTGTTTSWENAGLLGLPGAVVNTVVNPNNCAWIPAHYDRHGHYVRGFRAC